MTHPRGVPVARAPAGFAPCALAALAALAPWATASCSTAAPAAPIEAGPGEGTGVSGDASLGTGGTVQTGDDGAGPWADGRAGRERGRRGWKRAPASLGLDRDHRHGPEPLGGGPGERRDPVDAALPQPEALARRGERRVAALRRGRSGAVGGPLVEPIRPESYFIAYPNNIYGETPHTAMADEIRGLVLAARALSALRRDDRRGGGVTRGVEPGGA